MKKIAFPSLVLILFISITSLGQGKLEEALQGEWIKEDIKLEDGSTLYNPELTEGQFNLHFVSRDSFLVTYAGRTARYPLRLADSTISYRGIKLKIVKLEKPILEVVEVETPQGYKPLKIKFVHKPTFDLSYIPESYVAQNKEEVFLRIPGLLEPKFLNPRETAMDFIYREFRFPEYRKGGFVVRFVITKEGEMKGLRMVASSNNKYDQKLIDATYKTRGKWIPAEYNGVKVNCEVEFNFDLGYSNPNTTDTEAQRKAYDAQQNLEYANYYFGLKSYKSAIIYYNQAIEADPYLLDAYYKRAASYIFRKDLKNACKDYQTLTVLNQKRAQELFEEYCDGVLDDKSE